MYGIYQVLKRIRNLLYIAAYATSSFVIQINGITNSAALYFQGNMFEKFAVEFSGCWAPRADAVRPSPPPGKAIRRIPRLVSDGRTGSNDAVCMKRPKDIRDRNLRT